MNGCLEAKCPLGHEFRWLTGTPMLCPVCQHPMHGDQYPPVEALTPREKEVLALLARGMTNREIAENLYIEECTVEHHVHSIFRKLRVRNRTQAATYAIRNVLT
ncbi:MAG TPA: response regulator transcription factor [Chloroflexia bacterium]|jgi:DNA-binding NarL/FixJ family response regulator